MSKKGHEINWTDRDFIILQRALNDLRDDHVKRADRSKDISDLYEVWMKLVEQIDNVKDKVKILQESTW